MSSKQATTEEAEADFEARIHAAIKHQVKFSFKFGRQTLMVDAGNPRGAPYQGAGVSAATTYIVIETSVRVVEPLPDRER